MSKKFFIHFFVCCLVLFLGNTLVSSRGAIASDFQLLAREDENRNDDEHHGEAYFENHNRSGHGAKLGEMCGGIAAFQCQHPLECQLDGNFPDASGVCVHPFLAREQLRPVLISILWGNFNPDLTPAAISVSGQFMVESGTFEGKRNVLLEEADSITLTDNTHIDVATMTGPFQDGALLHLKGNNESTLIVDFQNIQARISAEQLHKEGSIILPMGTDGMELRVRLIQADQVRRMLQPRFQQNLCVQNLALDLDEESMNHLTEKIGDDKKLFDRVCKRYLHESKKNFSKTLGNFSSETDLSALIDELDILDEYDSLLEMSQQNPKLAQLFERLRKHRLHGEVVKDVKARLQEIRDSNASDDAIAKLANIFDESVERSRLAKFRDGLLRFRDVDDDDDSWFHDFVERMAEKGIVKGFTGPDGKPTGEFRPGNLVTRSEALKMVLEAIMHDIADGQPVLASVKAHWAAKYWKWAIDNEIDFASLADTPDTAATRGDIIRMIMQTAGVISPERDETCTFPDLDSTDPRTSDICYAQSLGVVSGDSDTGNFRPNDPINRAEVAKIINRLLDLWDLSDSSVDISE